MKSSLKQHIKSIHKDVIFACDQCDKCNFSAAWKSELLTHIKLFHEGVKFPCNKCDYNSTRKGSLLTHMKSLYAGVNFSRNMKGTLLKPKTSFHASV